jgi:hypothetical protein
MSSLGHSPVPGAGAGAGAGLSANQILQPTIAGGANPSNAHFTNQYGSIVGGVRGCPGAGGSAAALAGHAGYNIVPRTQSGGFAHRRGGKSKQRGNKRSGNKRKCRCSSKRRRSSCKCRGKCRCSSKKHRRGAMRGGLSALSPSSFSGANLPYHQYGSNIPNSPVFSLGGELSPAQSGMASPPPIDNLVNRCS